MGSGAAPGAPPEELSHVWQWFLALAGTRQSGMAPNPIMFAEIEAYGRLVGATMTPWEVTLLRRLDRVMLRAKAGGRTESEVTTGAGVSAMFRAMGAKRGA